MRKDKIQQAYYFNKQFEKIRFSCILNKEKKDLITQHKLESGVLHVVIGDKMYRAIFNEKNGDYHYLVEEIDPHYIYETFECLTRKVAYSVKQSEIVVVEPKINHNEKRIAYLMLNTVCEDEDYEDEDEW